MLDLRGEPLQHVDDFLHRVNVPEPGGGARGMQHHDHSEGRGGRKGLHCAQACCPAFGGAAHRR
eukprot:CAMPEP_0179087620 /NCGR_PEP_ID=MMETSP0796-20121207/39822_1 /TAXON_ID=73915 /ORGANISM="Pyrodinium bahamense, Strain pbaha01" /LENGTH=63 /DNA_ID=CAMNT_0020785133 /DNA_START=21 /DNA_END=208 /DNA_ORIENTATION=-